MTRVSTPCRIHLGLLNILSDVTHWPDGTPARRYGGIGFMVESPRIIVEARRSATWSSNGPSAGRALIFAQKTVAILPYESQSPFHIEVVTCPPEHVGLGVGTQLGLAVARAVATEAGHPEIETATLAQAIGRGERSAIGIHGFTAGGLLLEGGKLNPHRPAPLLGRYEIPAEWPLVVITPRSESGDWAGIRERQAFARPRSVERMMALTESMTRLIVLGMIPALIEQDVNAFGAAFTEYNRFGGRMFAEDQGGDYSSETVKKIIDVCLKSGATGAGQSSWGPTVVAVCPDEPAAHSVIEECRRLSPDSECLLTRADHRGAIVTQQSAG